ncbi:ABC transporter permease [Dictyoglomus thermophilum]|uniref:Binding-protein-dependent transport systems inner membrane Component:Tumour necrosis factor c/lymphotoxin-beta n=1 Tax=Dictyoglomus thermophilum (strain ATCC 35947 / DSM 3960 / H-6-12) TaxID=309799 RepID=B5YCL8_DICT6|nr:ABC transporter permease [Dictyoglomus thermophilum]ACI18837.1 binding-protein-dependent transport systems inner membrane Component:Tumour necrosis factor c/lymphotoxin-beta [Dictyoglomus thermophilum H-6-12]
MGRRNTLTIILFLLPAFVYLTFLFVYPFLYGLNLSLTDERGNFTLNNFIRFFSDPWDANTIWITLKIAIPATLLSILIAIPLAYYMRHGIKGEKFITMLLILPITLGSVFIAEGMLTYMGPNGWLNRLLIFLKITDKPLKLTHNYLGVLIALIIQGFPFVFLMLLGYISGIDPNLEKAASVLGANRWQIFWKVMFPLWLPGITMAMSLNFVMNFTVFPSAVLLGQPSGPTRVISISAFQWAFEKFNFHMSSAVAIIMGIVELIFILIVMFIRQGLYRGSTVAGKG